MRIGVIEYSPEPLKATPQRYIKKSAAECLVRRLLAVRVSKTAIMLVPVRQTGQALPEKRQVRTLRPKTYEHHMEPRIEKIAQLDRDLSDSYLREIAGLQSE